MEVSLKMLIIYLVVNIISISIVLGAWNTNDYLKREHSVVKPYQGK